MLDFIDISHHQRGLDLEKVFSLNPELDGVIVKATGGTSYVQNTCNLWVQQLIAMNRPFGFYHFLDDDKRKATGDDEAAWFVKNTRGYFGKGVPFADYEQWALKLGTIYLKDFLDTIYELTGVKASVYTSASVLKEQDFSKIADAGYGLWAASWGLNLPGGIQSDVKATYKGPFSVQMMRQYSSRGRLNGYSGNLDLNKFFGSRAAWDAYARISSKPVDVSSPKNEMRYKTTSPRLRIRKGPGTTYAPTGKYTGLAIVVITEIQNGIGSKNGWGKLKDGSGWISLDYAERIK